MHPSVRSMKTDSPLYPDGKLPSAAGFTGPPASPYDWKSACPLIRPQIDSTGRHVWPFQPALPIDVNFYLRDRGADLPMNRHDYFELSFIYSGQAVFRIDNCTVPVQEGDLLVIGGGVRHHLAQLRSDVAKTVALYFLPELICAGSQARGEDLEYLAPFLIKGEDFSYVVPADSGMSEDIFSLILRIHTEAASNAPASRLCLKTYLKMILALLVKYYSSHPASTSSLAYTQQNVRRLQPVFDYIENNYSERITVETAASLVAMSGPHFMRFFKRVTQSSFLAYLNRYRLAKAQSMLETTDCSIAEISQEVGFYDQSHFGMVFRKLMRTTPRQYRLDAVNRASST